MEWITQIQKLRNIRSFQEKYVMCFRFGQSLKLVQLDSNRTFIFVLFMPLYNVT